MADFYQNFGNKKHTFNKEQNKLLIIMSSDEDFLVYILLVRRENVLFTFQALKSCRS